ncbi:diacylglycerol kinase [Alkalimonas delamerensis]|uniref:Diacylglycerol kinase n=1 Tax=Alkalimonas delamerensis TaxID=265981 RepID=A0ABT9GKF7_9GAMM|nr:diacylglycerol kinase [Alkalimonas delamerensis]MDP4527442.1 diacylglycerol kinase [Alkalimonas delamerensis]
MEKPNGQGLGRVLKAAKCSMQGFAATWRHEAAFRQEAVLAMLSVPLAAWLAQSFLQFVLLIGVWCLVLIVELLNSAIETLTDRVSLERHELSGRAKDMGSAAVFLSLVLVALVWGSALYSRFWG